MVLLSTAPTPKPGIDDRSEYEDTFDFKKTLTYHRHLGHYHFSTTAFSRKPGPRLDFFSMSDRMQMVYRGYEFKSKVSIRQSATKMVTFYPAFEARQKF